MTELANNYLEDSTLVRTSMDDDYEMLTAVRGGFAGVIDALVDEDFGLIDAIKDVDVTIQHAFGTRPHPQDTAEMRRAYTIPGPSGCGIVGTSLEAIIDVSASVMQLVYAVHDLTQAVRELKEETP